MFERISRTWRMMGASWHVLKENKRLMVFPLISLFCCLLVMGSFAISLIAADVSFAPPTEDGNAAAQIKYYALLFAFYFCNYFVATFFNAAIIGAVIVKMRGGEASVSNGLHVAMTRVHHIFGWALVAATVGMLLRILEDRSKGLARIVTAIIGMAWSLITFLVVPVMVIEDVGPIDSVKRSASLLKKTWGEQIIGNIGFGLIFGLLFLLAVIGGVAVGFLAASAFGPEVGFALGIAVGVVMAVILGLISSTLDSIFRAALYMYAAEEKIPRGFDSEMLGNAMKKK
ncbi:MAG: DUF6159 family protein [Planctomycetota bacterium]|jgi:hypothetical protein